MKHNLKLFYKNISYTFTANVISLILSIFLIGIVPKVLGVKEYGYWQLYVFYMSFVGFFGFGWIDGVYLRYGGESYKDLEKKLFSYQFWSLVVFEVFICIVIFFSANILSNDSDKSFVIYMTGITCIVIMPRALLTYILQATNRIKDYATIIIAEKIFKTIIIVILVAIGVRNYRQLIFAEFFSIFISLSISIFYCKEIVFSGISSMSVGLKEVFCNIAVGVKLMLANVASLLIIGIVRFGIEHHWDVSTFGKISLTMSISNFLMIFIGAVSVVLFPLLRNISNERLTEVYMLLRTSLVSILFVMLLLYYPFRVFFDIWLPQYSDSFVYMAVLFPMCLYEAKMSMLVNTYLKTLRKEKVLLVLNICSVLLSLFLTFLTINILNSLTLSVFLIVVLLAVRCVVAEIYLARILNVNLYSDNIIETMMAALFIVTSWYIQNWTGTFIYGVGCVAYVYIKRNDLLRIKNVVFVNS